MTRIVHSTTRYTATAVWWLLMLAVSWLPLQAVAEKRVALVVGNAAYESVAPLDNPGNDATDIAAKLRALEFDLIEATDTDLSVLKGHIKQFSRELNGADVALFYYSGHAIQVQDNNYIVPVDATLGTELDVDLETLSLGTVLRQMQNKAKVNLVFLDACRDNPFLTRLKRGTKNIQATRGLSRVDTSHIGSVIVFATAPGETALDGTGRRNSPFTEAMLRHIDTPGQDIGIMLRKVRGDVIRATNSTQIPWERSSLTDAFYFSSSVVEPQAERPQPAAELHTELPVQVPVQSNGRLTVKAEPSDARVRIMNIRPTYRDGIELALKETYDIYVTREGYTPWRQQVELTQPDQVVAVVLERRILPPAPTPRLESYEPEMVLIRGGCYQMGSPPSEDGRDDDEKQHRVCVDDVYAATTETTVGQFKAFVDATGYRTEAERNVRAKGCVTLEGSELKYVESVDWQAAGFSQSSTMPVVCVSWNDAQVYLNWLREETGKPYRLPTEAEWEYAARGGGIEARYWGAASSEACGYANVADERQRDKFNFKASHNCNDGAVHTTEVASYAPNQYGLYDVLGNVWEWTCSKWDETYGGGESQCATSSEGRRSLRGGAWVDKPAGVRSAYRDRNFSDGRSNGTGFRVFQDAK